jgi:hypothetical protein
MRDERPEAPGGVDRPTEQPPDGAQSASSSADPAVALLRLLIGGAAEGTDRVLHRLSNSEPPRPDETSGGETGPDGPAAHRARYALIGFLFEACGGAVRGVSAVGRLTASAGRLWWTVVEPIARNPLLAPVRIPFELLADRGAAQIERWIRIGRAEERHGRDLARQLTRVPIDDVVAYLRNNPELEALVKTQARALLEELPDDPNVQSLVRSQADDYIDHLREHPEPIQELVQGQSVGLLGQVANVVREQAVTADTLLERGVRAALRRRPREALPEPPVYVQALAENSRHATDD